MMTVSDMVDGSAEQTTAKERETGFSGHDENCA